MAKRWTIERAKELFKQRGCKLLETEYINVSTNMRYVNCKTPMRYIAKCGHESTIRFDTFLNCSNATKMCRDCHKHTYHENPSDRNRTAAKVWRKAVYEKDNWTCVACGKKGGDLNAHHLDAYDTSVNERFDVQNGVTLCPSCHTAFHSKYGFGGNTKEQFQEWLL